MFHFYFILTLATSNTDNGVSHGVADRMNLDRRLVEVIIVVIIDLQRI